MPDGYPEILLLRRTPEAQFFLKSALSKGGHVLHREADLTVVSWPRM
jgi:hypothetical protein